MSRSPDLAILKTDRQTELIALSLAHACEINIMVQVHWVYSISQQLGCQGYKPNCIQMVNALIEKNSLNCLIVSLITLYPEL